MKCNLLVGMSMKNPNKDSELAKHLFQHPDHVFQWNFLMSVSMNICKRKNLEAFFIVVKHPTLNEQKDLKKRTLLRNGVTRYKIFCQKVLIVCFLGKSCFSHLAAQDKQIIMSLTLIWLLSKFYWSKCSLLGVSLVDL